MDPGIEASALSAYLSPTDHLSASAPPLRSAHSSLSPGLPPSLALVRELSLFCVSFFCAFALSLALSHIRSEVQHSLARRSLSGDIDRFALSTSSQSLPLSLVLHLSLSLSCSCIMPPTCTQCAGGTSGGSRACLRAPVMCAKCCRNNVGCARHVVDGAALPQQPQPVPQALPQPPVALPQAPAQPPPDPASAVQALSQLSALVQQLLSLLPALAAATSAQQLLPPVPQAAFPAQPAVAPLAQPALPPLLNSQPVGPVLSPVMPPLPPGQWPPPPPPPPSHLAAYPPPLGGGGPSQLLGQAQSAAQVSPQPTHSSAPTQLHLGGGILQASGSGLVDVHLRHSGQFSNTYPCDPSTVGTRLSRMPLGVLPVTPERTGKPPKSAEELREVLTHWLRNEPELQQDGHRQAYEDYVSKTVLFSKDYGISVASPITPRWGRHYCISRSHCTTRTSMALSSSRHTSLSS